MKLLTFLMILSILLLSCSTTESPSPESFEIVTTEANAEVPLEVTYSAYKDGDVKVDLIQYVTADGLQSINDPVLPWNITLNIPRGINFYIKAKGTITQGKITIKMNGFGEEGGHSQTIVDSTSRSKY